LDTTRRKGKSHLICSRDNHIVIPYPDLHFFAFEIEIQSLLTQKMSQKTEPKKTAAPTLVRVYRHPYERMVQELEDQGLKFNAGETWEEELARLRAEEQRRVESTRRYVKRR
jgi:hypothetical protein